VEYCFSKYPDRKKSVKYLLQTNATKNSEPVDKGKQGQKGTGQALSFAYTSRNLIPDQVKSGLFLS